MEALIAFGLAANVMQVVVFASEIVTNAKEIFEAGSTVQNNEIEIVASDIKTLKDRLHAFARPDPKVNGPLAQDEQALNDLANEAYSIADELHTKLGEIRHDKNRDRAKSLVQAVKTAMKSKRTKELQKRLQWIRDEIQFRLLVSMKSSIDLESIRSTSGVNSFDDNTNKIIAAILDNTQDLDAVVLDQNKRLTEYFVTFEQAAARRHGETMDEFRKLTARLNSQSISQTKDVDPLHVYRTLTRLLHFEKVDDRYEDIKKAYHSTFEWIFASDQSRNLSRPALDIWLLEQNGIYWISGKAGSGKSTFMKFIAQNPRTAESFRARAGGVDTLILSFYFWNVGTELQKSTKGLYQSLLYQALQAKNELAYILFPEQYQPNAKWEEFPSIHQLRRAWQRLVTVDSTRLQILLLIDGLDEFEDAQDSMVELAEMFTTVVASSNVSAILSSRPHSVFVDAFKSCPHIKLHELTRADISTYVIGQLQMHERMHYLAAENPKEANKLISNIVESSSGVFLWVRLVVQSLLEGLRNYDNFSILLARLDELPKDLEDLFYHMLTHRDISQNYRKQRSEWFQCLRLHQSLSASDNYVIFGISSCDFPLNATDVFAMEMAVDTIAEGAIERLNNADLEQRILEVEGWLRSRCAGLLELRAPEAVHDDSASNEAASTPNTRPHDTYMGDRTQIIPEVAYLHKSVADFLFKPEIWSVLITDASDSNFDPHLALLKSAVMRLKAHQPQEFDQMIGTHTEMHNVWAIVRRALRLAGKTQTLSMKSTEHLLDELDRVMTVHYDRLPQKARGPWNHPQDGNVHGWCDTILEDHNRPVPWHDNFLALAVRAGLKDYVVTKFAKGGHQMLQKIGRPLLDYSCRPEPAYAGLFHDMYPEIVEVLLHHGANPNEKFNGFSPWQNALYEVHSEAIEIWLAIILLLLKHGADVNTYVERYCTRYYGMTRYSALYCILKACDGIQDSDSVSPAAKSASNEVITFMRKKKAPIYVSRQSAKGKWTEHIITRDDAPFLTTADLINISRRKQIGWIEDKVSTLPSRLRKLGLK